MQLDDPRLDGILNHQPRNPHRPRLSNPMNSISRLPFDGRIIPGIHDEHLTRFREIESHTACSQGDEEDSDFGVLGEAFDGRGTGGGGHMSV